MLHCRVCGAEELSVIWRPGKCQFLCDACAKMTPRKVSREAFDRAYWGTGKAAAEVPEGTKREFYSDYLTSSSTLSQYIETTTTKLS